jgi:hypothetical protein
MALHPLSGPLQFEFQALSAALSLRETNGKLWIIRDPDRPDFYRVCQEAPFGQYKQPLCHAFFGVFVETDQFTNPTWRISLGPGVWPTVEDE